MASISNPQHTPQILLEEIAPYGDPFHRQTCTDINHSWAIEHSIDPPISLTPAQASLHPGANATSTIQRMDFHVTLTITRRDSIHEYLPRHNRIERWSERETEEFAVTVDYVEILGRGSRVAEVRNRELEEAEEEKLLQEKGGEVLEKIMRLRDREEDEGLPIEGTVVREVSGPVIQTFESRIGQEAAQAAADGPTGPGEAADMLAEMAINARHREAEIVISLLDRRRTSRGDSPWPARGRCARVPRPTIVKRSWAVWVKERFRDIWRKMEAPPVAGLGEMVVI